MHCLFRRRLECHQQLEGGITTSVFLYVLFPLIRDDLSIHLWLVVSSERNISSWAGKYIFNWKLLVFEKMELLFRISLSNNTMCLHCAVLIYQCCKQRSPGRDSRNPLLFPSPKKIWPPDHPEAVCAPVSYENNLCLSSAQRHLRYVVFKDIQGCEIALGVGGQDHGELKYILM